MPTGGRSLHHDDGIRVGDSRATLDMRRASRRALGHHPAATRQCVGTSAGRRPRQQVLQSISTIPFWSLFADDCELIVHDLRNHGWNRVGSQKDHNIPTLIHDHDLILRVDRPCLRKQADGRHLSFSFHTHPPSVAPRVLFRTGSVRSAPVQARRESDRAPCGRRTSGRADSAARASVQDDRGVCRLSSRRTDLHPRRSRRTGAHGAHDASKVGERRATTSFAARASTKRSSWTTGGVSSP